MPATPTLHLIPNAQVQEGGAETLTVSSTPPPWVGAVLLIVIAGLMINGGGPLLWPLMLLSIAVFLVVDNPLATRCVIDFRAGQIRYTARYVFYRPRQVEICQSIAALAHVGLRPGGLGQGRVVAVEMAEGTHLLLQFGGRAAQAEALVRRLAARAGPAAASAPDSAASPPGASHGVEQALLERKVKTWSVWLVCLGAAQVLAGQAYQPGGVFLVIIGLAAGFIREPPMLLVFAAYFAWSGLADVATRPMWWGGLAVMQALFTYYFIRIFWQYRRQTLAAPAKGAQPAGPLGERVLGRSGRLFPGLAISLGAASLAGLGVATGGMVINSMLFGSAGLAAIFLSLGFAVMYAGLLAVALGLAAWLLAFPHRRASLAGCAMGAATLLLILWGAALVAR